MNSLTLLTSDSNYFMTLPNKICFVDIETTGGSLRSDRIIEIGILRVENNKLVRTFQSLINPDRYLPEEIEVLTGINSSQLENAPSFYEIKTQILEILEDCVFVAHNVRFDYGFLKNEFKRFEKNFSPKHFCTVKLSRSLYPQYRHHNLDSIIERGGFECENRHRAFDDAKILFDFWGKVQKDFDENILLQALNKALKKPSLPINIPSEQIDELPEGPGVYIFYGDTGAPLYIGKSVNIRDRVLSHFSADHSSGTEMKISQQIKSIETISTTGELGALLKEASLIKKMQPLYNRQLRYSRELILLKKSHNDMGHLSVTLENAPVITQQDIDDTLGVFKSKKQAKTFLINLTKEYGLCEKLLGLENFKGGCFGYRLRRCKGACVGKEDSNHYNMRFIQAFSHTKIKSWPFEGPIVIKEDDILGEGEAFVLDKWCFLGTIKFDSFGYFKQDTEEIYFDVDTYKILVRFLNQERNLKKVHLLKDQEKYVSAEPDQMTREILL